MPESPADPEEAGPPSSAVFPNWSSSAWFVEFEGWSESFAVSSHGGWCCADGFVPRFYKCRRIWAGLPVLSPCVGWCTLADWCCGLWGSSSSSFRKTYLRTPSRAREWSASVVCLVSWKCLLLNFRCISQDTSRFLPNLSNYPKSKFRCGLKFFLECFPLLTFLRQIF